MKKSDVDTELGYTYLSMRKTMEKAGKKLHYRPATNKHDKENAQAIRRYLSRMQFQQSEISTIDPYKCYRCQVENIKEVDYILKIVYTRDEKVYFRLCEACR
jgi:hypothetical protein